MTKVRDLVKMPEKKTIDPMGVDLGGHTTVYNNGYNQAIDDIGNLDVESNPKGLVEKCTCKSGERVECKYHDINPSPPAVSAEKEIEKIMHEEHYRRHIDMLSEESSIYKLSARRIAELFRKQ